MRNALTQVCTTIGAPTNWRRMNGVAFALAVTIFVLFGFMLPVARWHPIWRSEWLADRAAALGIFVFGLLLIAQIIAAVISFLHVNGRSQ